MSFCSGFRTLFSCFGSNNSSNKGLASPANISGPRCFTHKKTGNPNIPLRAFVSTPPPYVQPERP
ncbi:hypothetical protein QM012_004637 [Aureobasidium pullulans]|uniref:Uncharacterized protein n=1 Tax=Aureobasidium pullulans TaxID=5580 RepID=A0ABR0TTS5_AURPU